MRPWARLVVARKDRISSLEGDICFCLAEAWWCTGTPVALWADAADLFV